ARNQLAAITGPTPASFVYDALGRRQRKTIAGTITDFVYDGLNPVREATGTTVVDLLTGLGIDEYLTRTTGGTTEHYLTDALGSTVALADGSGAVATAYSYEPFGAVNAMGASSGNELKYTGREDDGTGLQYYRARYYHPNLQRFISEDPIGFAGGDTNLYSYVGNAPTSRTDPSGLAPEGSGLGLRVTFPPSLIGRKDVRRGTSTRSTAINSPIVLSAVPVPVLVRLGALLGAAGAAVLESLRQAGVFDFDWSLSENQQERDGSQDKRVPDSVIKEMERRGTHPHELKESGKQDLFYDPTTGKIYVKPKSGKGPGEDTGLNIDDFRR
ncbi:MAG TPA: RHS repeat-associated core domain-containing protein, partial [Vicinamibacterales bacterium]|nr:RHS repeat-associated core domain-containing protein [Vicinamibacterales bacterium]